MENRKVIYNEWYWNLNLHRDRLSLANQSAIDGVIMPTSAAFYTSAVLTDVGICVGMRNVNLNCENQQRCFYSRKIPNCSTNNNKINKGIKETWDYACNQDRLPSHELNGNTSDLYAHQSDINSSYLMPITFRLSPFDTKDNNDKIYAIDTNISNTYAQSRYYSVIDGGNHSSIKYDSNSIQIICDEYNGADEMSYVSNANSTSCSKHFSGHVAPPKKKWIRDYMQSNFH